MIVLDRSHGILLIFGGAYMLQRLLRPVGVGSFGEVWSAELAASPARRIQFALKASFQSYNEETIQEESTALREVVHLQHQAIISIKDIFIEFKEKRFCIAMELAESTLLERLHQYRSHGSSFPIPELMHYIREIAEGLDYLHNRELIHGGLNPTDVLLSAGHAKIGDFGPILLPERTKRLGIVVPYYKSVCMAPELRRGDPTKRSDQYALAATYAWVRFDHPIFPAITGGGMEMGFLRQLEQEVLLTALDEDPSRRFPTCLQFAKALETAVTE